MWMRTAALGPQRPRWSSTGESGFWGGPAALAARWRNCFLTRTDSSAASSWHARRAVLQTEGLSSMIGVPTTAPPGAISKLPTGLPLWQAAPRSLRQQEALRRALRYFQHLGTY